MLLCVVLVFGVSYLPTGIAKFGLHTSSNSNKELFYKIFAFGQFATSLNSSVNFIIYCVMSPNFRATFMELRRNPSGSAASRRRGTNSTETLFHL